MWFLVVDGILDHFLCSLVHNLIYLKKKKKTNKQTKQNVCAHMVLEEEGGDRNIYSYLLSYCDKLPHVLEI